MDDTDCDVLIAGGGPTGVTLAILLARLGVKVVVAEREAAIYPLPRAAHLDHEAMRILQAAGAADQVFATSRRAARYDFLTARRDVLMRLEGADRPGPGGWPAANMIHQPSVEAALHRSLARLPEARLEHRWELLGFVDDGAQVVSQIATPEGPRTLRSRFLVGADGARSPVRTAAGIAFDDLRFEEPWLVVDALVDDPSRLPTANLQICDPKRPTTCVLMGEGRHRWEFMILPGETPEQVSEDAFIESFGRSFSTLPPDAWPERGFACTAVDAVSGAFQVWSKDSGVGVVRAVASSCSVPGVYPPVTLKGRRYIDGGMRSATNADMAVGHDLVAVIALRLGAGGGVVGERIAAQFDEEIETLKGGGATVLTITPDEASVAAFGLNLMDFHRRADAARAGLAQGLAYAKDVKPYWS